MTRFFGAVGFGKSVRKDGVTEEVVLERKYKGDEVRSTRYFRNGESVLGEVTLQTRISITADAYALENYLDIKYVVLAGTPWTVTQAEPERPRLLLVLGDKYNGPLPEESDE